MDNVGSVAELLDQLKIEVTSEGEREIAARCPFHEDSHPSFSINRESGLWICYQCQRSGTLDMLVEAVGGVEGTPDEILREVRRRKVSRKRAERDNPLPPKPEPVIDPLAILARYETFGDPPAWALEERMLDPEVTHRYGVRWARGWVIPIVDPKTRALMGWQWKGVDSVSNYPRAIKKSTTLFGLQQLRSRRFALVESPLDVVRLASVGVPAVSSYGAYVSRVQLGLIIERAERLVLALDNDAAGMEQTAKIYPRLARQLPTKRVAYPPKIKDPGDMSDEEVVDVFGEIQRVRVG